MRKPSFLLLLTAIIFLTSCAKQPTTLRMVLTLFPETFDALKATNRFATIVEDNIFETLLSENNLVQPQNVLIDYFYFIADTLMVMRYKDNIRFSDGSLLTSDDIISSIHRYYDIVAAKATFSYSDIKAFEDNIIHIYLDGALLERFQLNNFYKLPIYKGEYIREFNDEMLGELPLGTGPYYLYSATDKTIILKKNQYYRDYAIMSHNPDIVEYYYEPNLHSQYQMLKTNEADFILDMEFVDYTDGITDPNIKIYSRLSDYFSYMALDAMSVYRRDINLPFNPLRDVRVRQAIAHSIDMEQYVKNTLSGQAIALTMPSPVQIRDYPVDLPYYTFDLELASHLMAEAGVADGFQMSLFSTQGFYSIRLSEFIRESLKQIKIDVVISYFDGSELYQALARNTPSSFIVIYGSSIQNRTLASLIRNHMGYTSLLRNRANYLKLNNHKINVLLDSLLTENIDTEKKYGINNRLIETVFQEVMVLPLFQPYIFHGLRTNIVWHTKKNNIPLAREFEVR